MFKEQRRAIALTGSPGRRPTISRISIARPTLCTKSAGSGPAPGSIAGSSLRLSGHHRNHRWIGVQRFVMGNHGGTRRPAAGRYWLTERLTPDAECEEDTHDRAADGAGRRVGARGPQRRLRPVLPGQGHLGGRHGSPAPRRDPRRAGPRRADADLGLVSLRRQRAHRRRDRRAVAPRRGHRSGRPGLGRGVDTGTALGQRAYQAAVPPGSCDGARPGGVRRRQLAIIHDHGGPLMIGDALVFDGVAHPFNFEPDNAYGWAGEMFSNHLYAFHATLTPEGEPVMSAEEFLHKWSIDEIREMVYERSQTDMLVAMPLPLTDLYKDGGSPWQECAKLAQRDPDRTVFWGTVNPLEGKKALDDVTRQVEEYGARAFKFYNVRYEDGGQVPVSYTHLRAHE